MWRVKNQRKIVLSALYFYLFICIGTSRINVEKYAGGSADYIILVAQCYRHLRNFLLQIGTSTENSINRSYRVIVLLIIIAVRYFNVTQAAHLLCCLSLRSRLLATRHNSTYKYSVIKFSPTQICTYLECMYRRLRSRTD